MKIQFCGAAQVVTGSCHLLTLDNGFTILLDCGLFQGREAKQGWNEKWFFNPADIDCLVLSHAHIDHSGRIPQLVKDGFRGTIHCTHATRSLCAIMLLDSAKIQEKDAEMYNRRLEKQKNVDEDDLKEPLYTPQDVDQAMRLYTGYAYDRWYPIHEDVEVLFTDAGHILGSACVTLRIKENGLLTTFGFTGDVGRPDRPILRDPHPMPEVDFLICESTYGDKEHLESPADVDRFMEIIYETCIKNRGKLIIPAFSVGRTQELVYILDRLETAGSLPYVKVFVDSPLSVNATTIFGSHPECFDDQLNQYLLIDDNPFGFNNLTYIKEVEASKALNSIQEPCIIISSSGMMEAGRIRHHLFNSLEDPRNTILIVGYCSPDTPGSFLREGAKVLKLFGEWKQVNAKVEVMDSFSAHADRSELLQFLSNQRKSVQKIFLVHGEIERQEHFKNTLLKTGFKEIVIPEMGQEVVLEAKGLKRMVKEEK